LGSAAEVDPDTFAAAKNLTPAPSQTRNCGAAFHPSLKNTTNSFSSHLCTTRLFAAAGKLPYQLERSAQTDNFPTPSQSAMRRLSLRPRCSPHDHFDTNSNNEEPEATQKAATLDRHEETSKKKDKKNL
jgi:hypothetical protein